MKNSTNFIIYSIAMAMLLIILTLLAFILSTLISSYTGSKLLSVAVLPGYAFASGYLFSKISHSYGTLKVVISGVIGSVALAGFSGIQKVIFNSLNEISQAASSMKTGNQGTLVDTEAMVNPDLLFTLLLVSFNAPVIYSPIESDSLESKYLVLYLAPILVHLMIPMLFNEFL